MGMNTYVKENSGSVYDKIMGWALMNTATILTGFIILFSVVVCVLYILFGQITVRRLRKNPQTREALGFEFVSGWDIINAAQALSLPKPLMRKLENSLLGYLYSNAEILYQNTNLFDRILARVLYYLLMFSGLSGALIVLLNALGLLD